MTQPVTLEVTPEGVALIQMQDKATRNAFGVEFVNVLVSQLEKAARHPDTRVCVLSGLEQTFCSGGDRDVLLSLAEGKMKPYDLVLTRSLMEVPVPTISAMAGDAVGGGLIFGLSCDMVLLGRESRYGCNFMDLGFTPGMGTTRLLEMSVGTHLAAEMMFGCQYFKGQRFENSHVNYVLPRAEVLPKAISLGERIAEKPKFALELLKRDLVARRRRTYEDALSSEALMHQVCFSNPETRERIRENFLSARSS